MRGKWAQGIVPRHFTWILKDKFAVCERPGGYGENHRKVRRHEEIIWLRQNNFHRVISLINGPQNLHNYDELEMPWRHVPLEVSPRGLGFVFGSIRDELNDGHRIVMHGAELGDNIAGIVAGYLLWSGLVPTGPQAINVAGQILEREIGPSARSIVAMVDKIPPPDELVMPVIGAAAAAAAAAAENGDGAISEPSDEE